MYTRIVSKGWSQSNLFKLDNFPMIQSNRGIPACLSGGEWGSKSLLCARVIGESTFGPCFHAPRASSVTSRGEQWATRTVQLDILTLWLPSRRFLDRLRDFFYSCSFSAVALATPYRTQRQRRDRYASLVSIHVCFSPVRPWNVL